MRISAVTLENFKGIRDPATVRLRPVTLLFGANSAGKSSIVQGLHYAHELLERHNADAGKTLVGGEAIELGGFEALVHGHNRGRIVRVRLDLEFDFGGELPEYGPPNVDRHTDIEVSLYQHLETAFIDVQVAWSEILEKPILMRYEVGLNGVTFAVIEASKDLKSIGVTHLALDHPVLGTSDGKEESEPALFDLVIPVLAQEVWDYERATGWFGLLGQLDAVPNWGRTLNIQEEAFAKDISPTLKREFIETISQLIVGPGELARDALRSLRYVGPLRQVPSRNFEPIRSPDESRWAAGLAAWDILAKADDHFLHRVNDWLGKPGRLETTYRIKAKRFKEVDVDSPLMHAIREHRALDEDVNVYSEFETAPTKTRLVLRDDKTGLEVLPQDVGIGLSQLIPVLVAALYRPGIVAVEQPELHIHPRWQVLLGDLFLSEASGADATFVIETHSEHLVLRLMRRMRETFQNTLPPGAPRASPTDIAIYVVEVDQEQTITREMPLTESGDLVKAWPGGFFEERLPEMLG